MAADEPVNWMWSEAMAMLARAERIHRDVFPPVRVSGRPALGRPAWAPPADVIETEAEVLIFIALPGVRPDEVQAAIEDGTLVVRGRRALPPQLRTAVIHRLELPQGPFERRIPLPAGRYDGLRRMAADGCLLISLRKAVRGA